MPSRDVPEALSGTIVTVHPTARSRDERIDFWRGLCIVGMASWHLLTHQSFPQTLAFSVIQPFNFVAEGFVLLAGTAVGLQFVNGTLSAGRLLRRAGEMLLVNYGLIGFVVVLSSIEVHSGLPVQARPPGSIWDVLVLHYQPYLADVLTVFVFLFATAPVFTMVYERWAASGLVLLSAGLFATAHLFPLNSQGAFVYNSWQIFFVAGFLLGVHYRALVERKVSAGLLVSVLLLFVGIAAFRFVAGQDGAATDGWGALYVFSRKPLTIARVTYIGLQLLVIGLFTLRWWPWLARTLAVRSIASLGRFSLHVFVASVILDYLLKLVLDLHAIVFPANLLLWAGELAVLFVLSRALMWRHEKLADVRLRSRLAAPHHT